MVLYRQRVEKEGEESLRNSTGLPAQKIGSNDLDRAGALATVAEWEKEVKRMKHLRQLESLKYGRNPPIERSSQANMLSANGGWHGRTPIHVAHGLAFKPDSAIPEMASDLASAETKRERNFNTAVEDIDGLKPDQSMQGLSSAKSIRKVIEPSVPRSRNVEKLKETSSGLTNGLKKSSTSKQAYRGLDIHEKLNSIYESVLVVDNITVAKEVVGKLTNKYKHLVHACDTEVLLGCLYVFISLFTNYCMIIYAMEK